MGSGRVIRVGIVAATTQMREEVELRLESPDMVIVTRAAAFGEADAEDSDADVMVLALESRSVDHTLDELEGELEGAIPVVLLGEPLSSEQWERGLRLGVRASLPEEVAAETLQEAVRAVLRELIVATRASIIGALQRTSTRRGEEAEEPVESLTPREGEVLRMMGDGWSNKEIAGKLKISEHTVKSHVAAILGKLGAGTRTEAVSIAMRRGLLLF